MTDLAIFELPKDKALAVFTDGEKYSEFYQKLKAETDKFVPDVTTSSGRDEIRSTAFKITKVKTALAKQALDLTEDWRSKTSAVNKSKTKMVTELEGLADAVRKPLTEWETAEETRTSNCKKLIENLRTLSIVPLGTESSKVQEVLETVQGVELVPAVLGDMLESATYEQRRTIEILTGAIVRLKKEESDRAELKRLQDEAAERKRSDEEKAATETAEREAVEQLRLKSEREETDKKAQADWIEKATQEATEKAETAAREKAEAEKRETERKHQEELAAEKARSDKLAKDESDRQQRANDEAEAQKKREADQAHRTSVKTAVKQALMNCGANEETARNIVLALLAGEIPNVSWQF